MCAWPGGSRWSESYTIYIVVFGGMLFFLGAGGTVTDTDTVKR